MMCTGGVGCQELPEGYRTKSENTKWKSFPVVPKFKKGI